MFAAEENQKENNTCKSIRRFADEVLKGPLARAVDVPAKGESTFPTGDARLT
jgi:hypothetical protein